MALNLPTGGHITHDRGTEYSIPLRPNTQVTDALNAGWLVLKPYGAPIGRDTSRVHCSDANSQKKLVLITKSKTGNVQSSQMRAEILGGAKIATETRPPSARARAPALVSLASYTRVVLVGDTIVFMCL